MSAIMSTPARPIAELDPLDLKLQVASATATLTSARASRDLAQSEYNRYQSLLDKHFISQTQFDTQVNTLKAAEAQVQQAHAALAVARNQAEYTTLRADHAGVITAINAEAGQVVTAGQPVATLARDGAIEVEIAVPENRIANYQVGTPALDRSLGGWRQTHERDVARDRAGSRSDQSHLPRPCRARCRRCAGAASRPKRARVFRRAENGRANRWFR